MPSRCVGVILRRAIGPTKDLAWSGIAA